MRIAKIKNVPMKDLLELFLALDWESARFPQRLCKAISSSACVRTLWCDKKLVGLVNAISDGSMAVYFPYVAIHPDFQGLGWGKRLLQDALVEFRGFPHIALIAYADKIEFYKKSGFTHDTGKAALFFRKETE